MPLAGLVMMGLVAAFAVVVGAILIYGSRVVAVDRGALNAPRLLKPGEARLSQLPAIVNALSNGKAEPRWAALMFTTPDRPSSDDAVNLNLSVEDGKVGFDWVLLATPSIEDEEKFRAFARSRGVEPSPRKMNGVSYLRVEAIDVAQFTADVVTEMYQRPSDEVLDLVYEGFEWPQGQGR